VGVARRSRPCNAYHTSQTSEEVYEESRCEVAAYKAVAPALLAALF
jgi:hypothetical protein